MNTILSLMRSDLLMLNAKKKGFQRFMILVLIITAVLALLGSPMLLPFCIVVYALIAVEQFFQTVSEANAMYSVLPASRTALVRARFLLMSLLIGGVTLFCYVIAIFYSGFDIAERVFGEDILSALSPLGGALEMRAQYCIFVSLGFLIAMAVNGILLKKRMLRDHGVKRSALKKFLLVIVGFFVFEFVAFGFFFGARMMTGVLGSALSMLMQLISLIGNVFDGLLLSILLILTGIGFAFYSCLSTELEYEKKEL